MPSEFTPAATGLRLYADGRMSAQDAAKYLGLSYKVLCNQRSQGIGPSFYKAGKFVFYRKNDLDQWLESCRVGSTAEYRARNRRGAA
ncbi:MAG: helix-turn-helix domain-containing protein [Candidatus Competibacteraceae bacterium]|nr:helix-turn-helix domain-containing protein [Candidatus Competibacteraceae bacterium]